MVEHTANPGGRNVQHADQLPGSRLLAAILCQLGVDRDFAAGERQHAPRSRLAQRPVAHRPRLAGAVGERIKRPGQFAPVHLSQFIEDQDGIGRAGRRTFQSVGGRAPGADIAGSCSPAPNARRHLQQGCLALGRLAAEMDTAALGSGQTQQRSRQRGGNRQHRQDMAARQPRRAVAPILDASARLIGAMRRGIENDPLAPAPPDRLARQDESRSPADLVPARPRNDGDAARRPDAGKVADKVTLPRSVDPQAKIREASAKRRRFAMQVGVGDMPQVLAPVVIPPSQHVAPARPVRIATCPEDFERRGDPNDFRGLFLAPASLDFDGEAVRVHRVGTEGHNRPVPDRTAWRGPPPSCAAPPCPASRRARRRRRNPSPLVGVRQLRRRLRAR